MNRYVLHHVIDIIEFHNILENLFTSTECPGHIGRNNTPILN